MNLRNLILTPIGLLLVCVTLYAQPNITRIEYFIDTDPGLGNGISIPFIVSNNVNLNATLDLSSVPDGFHWINLRGMDSDKKWSHSVVRFLYKGAFPSTPILADITKIEYFLDTDPGLGNGTSVTFTPGTMANINQIFDISSLSDGFHRIILRGKDADGRWSHMIERLFYKGEIIFETLSVSNITRAEYFIDTDPGLGKGTALTITPGTNVSIEQIIDVSAISNGFHWFYARSRDAKGHWSYQMCRIFYVGPYAAAPPVPNIKRVEYFFDTDPGVGQATPMQFTSAPLVNISENLNISALSIGKHKFAVRIKDSNGNWSYLTTRSFITDITAPAAPQNPIATPGDRRVTLKWKKNNEADFLKYLIYSGNASGSETLADSTSAGLSDTTKILTGLTNNTNYYFYITAIDSARLESSHSTEVNATPVAPTGLPASPVANPPTGILQNSFIANWSLCSTATGYRIDVATDIGFSSILASYDDKDVFNVSNYQVTGLNVYTTYYYRIRAYNNEGTNPVASNIITVKTLLNPPTPPSPPVAVSPSAVNQTSFVANWQHSESATGYKLDVSEDIGFGSFVSDYNKKDVLYTTNYSVTGLLPDKIYYYRVYGYNAYGTGTCSNVVSAKTPATPLNLPSAPAAIAGTNPTKSSFTANWSSSAGATGYYLDVATDNQFTSIVPGYNKKDVASVTNYNVTGLTPNTNYYYRVYAYNNDGSSTPSGTINVKTLLNIPAAPSGLTAASCNDLVTLQWRKNSEPDFKLYKIYGGTSADPTTEIGTASNGVSDTAKVITGLTRGQTYYFRISAENMEGNVSSYGNSASVVVYKGVKPKIVMKWGDILICPNVGDSIQNYQWHKDGSLIPGATKQYYVTNKLSGYYEVYTVDNHGCTDHSDIKSVGGKKSLSIYPNPAQINVSVKINNNYEERALVRLYNTFGMKVFERYFEITAGESINEIPVLNLAMGVYYLEITINDEKINYSKIVVTK